MSKISKFDLISGADIEYDGIRILHPPHLIDIKNIGYEKYNSYLNFLSIDKNKYLEIVGISPNSICEIKDLCIFDIWISNLSMREQCQDVLSFFISGDVIYSISKNAFKVSHGNEEMFIDRNNYADIVSLILNLNCLNFEDSEEIIFQDEASKKLYEKIQKAKKEGKLKSDSKDFLLSNLISSVAAYGNGYTLNNLWDLTIYQLYDQFYRLDTKFHLDIIGTRWAAWGKEDFDFDVWHKDINLIK